MIKREATRTSHTNPLRVTFSVGGLTVRRGDALAEFAERSVMEFSGDHSARRHMHLEIRGSPFAILPRNEAETRIPCSSKTLRRVSTLMERSPNQAIRRPAMRLFGLPSA